MIDIYTFHKSLKSNWIRRLLDTKNNGLWKLFYLKKLEKFGGKIFFECNLKEKDIKQLFPKKSFFQDILLSWFELNDSNVDNIGKQLIWNNSQIKVGNKTLFNRSWHNRGIQFVEQLYDYRTREFYKFSDFINLYELPNNTFLFFMSLISSIPKEWKVQLKSEEINNHRKETLLSKLFKSKQANKYETYTSTN